MNTPRPKPTNRNWHHANSTPNFRPPAPRFYNNQNAESRTTLFQPYWNLDDVTKGLADGTLIKGVVRINVKNFEEAYIADPNEESNDIFINGVIDRNRALQSDVVAVCLKNREKWRILNPNEHVQAQSAENDDVSDTNERLNKYDRSTLIRHYPSTPALDENLMTKLQSLKLTVDVEGQQRQFLERITSPLSKQNKTSPMKPKKMYTTVSDMNGLNLNDDALLKTAEVVYILERKHTRIATGKLRQMQDSNTNWALFAPNDSRVPRMMIPVQNCPPTFMQRPQDFERVLFLGRLVDWQETSKFARGELAKLLGNIGEVEAETEGLLAEYEVDSSDFVPNVLECLPKVEPANPWAIPKEEFDYREDFRQNLLFTIDPATARDLDDALHVKQLSDGLCEIGVHIADVAFFVKPKTGLDVAAQGRATSVYLVHKVIPMLPRLLCEELCSLNPGVDRLAFSVIWKMNQDGNVVDERFTRSVIRSCCKLNYDHAQGFITEPDRDWTRDDLPPISEPYGPQDLCYAVNVLQSLAVKMRQARQDSGALRLDQLKLSFTLDQDNQIPTGCCVYKLKDSNRLIEEFMLKANMAVATRIYQFYPKVALLRRHPVPKPKVMKETLRVCREYGFILNASSSTSLQSSLNQYKGESRRAKDAWLVLMQLLFKPMKLALYFCTGALGDEALFRHYALNVPFYTHFTSPIRRYPDIMVHRLLGATLDYNAVPDIPMDNVQTIANHCNDKKYNAKNVSTASGEMFFALFVQKCGPLPASGIVIGVLDHSFDVLLTKFGVTKRIYCSKLSNVTWTFVGNKELAIGTLTIVETTSRKSITISVFDRLKVTLQGSEEPLKFDAKFVPNFDKVCDDESDAED